MVARKTIKLPCIVLCLVIAVGTTSAAACSSIENTHDDEVFAIPGYPQGAPPGGRWFSGYLDYEVAGQQVHTHYLLQQAELDPSNEKPLIYWSNGGPGASSLFGLLTELGPLLLNELSLQTDEYRATGIPTPLYNEYAWTRLGSLLSFDQPAPVGFSYCNSLEENNKNPHSCGGITWTDELASEASYKALQAFYKKFPCYVGKDLYLTGESYAGIYIPTLAREIVRGNNEKAQDDKNAAVINLKGFAVGDGCLGTETGICGDIGGSNGFDVWNILFLAGHGQIPMETFREVMHACHDTAGNEHDDKEEDWSQLFLRGMASNTKLKVDDDDMCQEALKKVERQVGGVYAYGLYDECTYSNSMLQAGLNDYPCSGSVMNDYLNLPSVHEALHVKSDFFSADNAIGFDYVPSERDLTGFYKQINGKLRVLVYNGDTDPAINSFAAQNWTSHLGFLETESWRPWTLDYCRKMGGYITRYEGDFDFLTIRGAGHMVPAIKASASFTFMKSWIENTEYPSYDKDCQAPGKGKEQRPQVEMTAQ